MLDENLLEVDLGEEDSVSTISSSILDSTNMLIYFKSQYTYNNIRHI